MTEVAVRFVNAKGRTWEVEVAEGVSVMQAAIDNDVVGIVAECGGECVCATCHVYVEQSAADLLPPVEPLEDEMLEGTASPRQPNSRLSCQIKLSRVLNGMLVHIPPAQY